MAEITISPKRFSLTHRTQHKLYAYLFVIPAYILFVVFIVIPFFRTLGISTTAWRGFDTPRFIGLANFENLLKDRVFWIALGNTATFTIATTLLQSTIPLLVAVLVNTKWRGSTFFRTALFIPVIISFVVTGLLWRMIYDPTYGTVNSILTAVGLQTWTRAWLAEPQTALSSIIVVSLWQSLGFYMLIYFAGLQGIPIELYESASLDGAGVLQRLRHITIPMLWPVTTIVLVINVIGGIKVFDIIYVMTTGGPNHATDVLGTYLYITAFGASGGGSASMGYAAAIGVVILVLAMVATIIQFRLTRRRGDV
jgi:ABC-type sugar transport system permease subunit